jgi:FkbM family methyltransferase
VPQDAALLAEPPADTVVARFPAACLALLDNPLIAHALAEFRSESEAGTREFFDAVLPRCDAMVDVGAHVGLTALYCAGRVDRVTAFEPSPVNLGFLEANIALNPGLADRIRVQPCGLGARDEEVTLYAKSLGDSGTSIHELVERAQMMRGRPLATAWLQAADPTLRALGVGRRTLVKIDIEGAEYQVVPALAGLLAEAQPFLHLSCHPFNLVVPGDAYRTALARVRGGIALAEALACYPHMYFYRTGRWIRVGVEERMELLERYLLEPKRVPGLASPQYGFIDAIGLSPEALPELGG